jgi:phosphoserine phosphatase RsbU/P
VKFCQAGHPTPIFLSAGGKLITIGSGGFPVGLWPDIEYEESSVHVAPGDRLLLYSDGVIECRNPAGTAYSEQYLKSILRQELNAPLSSLIERIQNDTSKWRGRNEFADDVSMLVLESI